MSGIDIGLLAHGLLDDAAASHNPRSVTAVREFDGEYFHLKRTGRDLEQEVTALRLAGRAGEVGGVSAIELTGFDSASNVLVTRHVDAESLFNRVWNGTSQLRFWNREEDDWPALFGRLARWLSAFHCTARDRPGVDPAACGRWLLDSFRSKVEHIRGSEAVLLEAGEADAILDYARDALASEAWNEQRIALLHGDFVPVNVLAETDGSLRVLDFGDARVGFALEDLVRLWAGVWELAESSRRRAHFIGPALTVILESYGHDANVVESSEFRLLRAWNAVTRVCERSARIARYDPSTRWIHRRLARAQLDWLRRTIL